MTGADVPPRPLVEVAVGVLVREDGSVLLASRPPGKPYAGYWEFSGGKVEPGEAIAAALARELDEELRIRIGPSMPWLVYEHDYPHAYVRLYFRRIFAWQGTPHPAEGQALAWLAPGAPVPEPMLPGAWPALRALQLPARITAEARPGAIRIDEPAALASAARRGFAMALLPRFDAADPAWRRALELTPVPAYVPAFAGEGDPLGAARALGAHGLMA